MRLFAPVDIASLVYFRIAFGAIMLWEVWRYISYGRIARYWIDPTFHFTYYGFEWLRPRPGDGMYLHFLALGGLAILIMLGLWYRVSTLLFFLGFTYVFLLEKAPALRKSSNPRVPPSGKSLTRAPTLMARYWLPYFTLLNPRVGIR